MSCRWRTVGVQRRGARVGPPTAEFYCSRGVAKEELGRHEGAIADYGEAIGLNPQFGDAYYNRGNVRVKLGRREEAITDYGAAIRVNPQDADAYIHRDNVYLSKGMTNRAITDYSEAIRLSPDDNMRRQLEKAVHDLGRTGPQNPGKRSILELRGLGKEIWEDVDAPAYVEGLRKEWDPKR